MVTRAHLAVARDLRGPNQTVRVWLSPTDEPIGEHADGEHLAISPLYAASAGGRELLNLNAGEHFVVFFCHENPFECFAGLPNHLLETSWFSLGIPSIIYISSEPLSDADRECYKGGGRIIATEIWHVTRGFATLPTEIEFQSQPRGDENLERLRTASNADCDVRTVAKELRWNLRSLRKRCALFLPELVPTIVAVQEQAERELAKALEYKNRLAGQLCSEVGDGENGEGVKLVDPILIQRRINLAVDWLIHANSSLAYLTSQSFYGCPPLLSNIGLISHHSLLGVGMATKALYRFSRFLGSGFGGYDITGVLERHYPDLTIGQYFKAGARSNESDWQGPARRTVDSFLSDAAKTMITPKIAYFSSRLGFKEFQNALTAATQCLHGCDSARWTFLTLTHELMHSHVRLLLAEIFSPRDRELPENASARFAVEFRNFVEKRRRNESEAADLTILEFLRVVLFSFADQYACAQSVLNKSKPEGPLEEVFGGARTPVGEEGRLKAAYAFINEIIVHVLDLHYFYRRDLPQYLEALWESWATVPGVVDRIEWYLLRALVAAGSTQSKGITNEFLDSGRPAEWLPQKSVTASFNEAKGEIAGALASLIDEKPIERAVIGGVIARLEDRAVEKWLRWVYPGALMVAQSAKEFLFSRKLRAHFENVKDPLYKSEASKGGQYRLKSMSFFDRGIADPLAFLRQRLSQSRIDEENGIDEETRSAWVLLALASIRVPGEESDQERS